MTQQQRRANIIAMVADGDLRLVGITTEGPRFEYTRKGRKRWCRANRRTSDLLIKTLVIVAWWIGMFVILGWLRN